MGHRTHSSTAQSPTGVHGFRPGPTGSSTGRHVAASVGVALLGAATLVAISYPLVIGALAAGAVLSRLVRRVDRARRLAGRIGATGSAGGSTPAVDAVDLSPRTRRGPSRRR